MVDEDADVRSIAASTMRLANSAILSLIIPCGSLGKVGTVACYGPLGTQVAYQRLSQLVIAIESVPVKREIRPSLWPVVRENVEVLGPSRAVGIACRMCWGHWESRQ